MAETCCKVVGNLNLCAGDVDLGCITSASVSSRLEVIKKCGSKLLVGSNLVTVSLTAYASDTIYRGCPNKATVSIQWLKKFDCAQTYFIQAGEGPSSIVGNIRENNTTLYYLDYYGKIVDIAVLNISVGKAYGTLNASSGSGPASIYMKADQVDGYGLTYLGGPIPFDTSIVPDFSDPDERHDIKVNGKNYTVYSIVIPPLGIYNTETKKCEDQLCGGSILYLQSFSLDMNPGEIPVASYSYNFVIDDI